jgi:hypothetical protein
MKRVRSVRKGTSRRRNRRLRQGLSCLRTNRCGRGAGDHRGRGRDSPVPGRRGAHRERSMPHSVIALKQSTGWNAARRAASTPGAPAARSRSASRRCAVRRSPASRRRRPKVAASDFLRRSITRRGLTTRARPTARIQLPIYRQRKSTLIPKTFRRLLTKNPQEIDRTIRQYLCL